MRASGVRFRPPGTPITPELEWVLLRAFGPPGWSPAAPVPGAACGVLAAHLSLAPRIAARAGAERLWAELGEEIAERFRGERARAAAEDLRWRAVAAEVAETAAGGVGEVVFLKHMALSLAGAAPRGSRRAADLDVLVAPERVETLARALEARGYSPSSGPGMEHHLPPLRTPSGGTLEIHRRILGLRLGAGRESATAPALRAAGLLDRVPGMPEHCAVPVRAVLVAHALVHGLAQHGWAPHAYPALRTLADLLDLGLGDEGGVDLAGAVIPWVARDVPPEEVEGVRRLCRRLGAGDPSLLREAPEGAPEAALLHHALAGALDPDYRSSLRLRVTGAPTDRRPLAGALAAVARTLVPGKEELAAVYGRPGSALGYWRLRLIRPFDLVRRAFRYAASARRLRRRGGGPAPGGE